MRTAGSPKSLGKVHDRTVRRWVSSYRREGREGVVAAIPFAAMQAPNIVRRRTACSGSWRN